MVKLFFSELSLTLNGKTMGYDFFNIQRFDPCIALSTIPSYDHCTIILGQRRLKDKDKEICKRIMTSANTLAPDF